MKIRLAMAATLMPLGGCDGPPEGWGDARAETASTDGQESASWFFLNCTGTSTKSYGVFQETRLYAVPDTTDFGDKILEYNFEDKLFYGACSNRSFECTEIVSNELIDARGGEESDIPTSTFFKINRITGKIDIHEWFNHTLSDRFEGACEKTDRPREQAAKF